MFIFKLNKIKEKTEIQKQSYITVFSLFIINCTILITQYFLFSNYN